MDATYEYTSSILTGRFVFSASTTWSSRWRLLARINQPLVPKERLLQNQHPSTPVCKGKCTIHIYVSVKQMQWPLLGRTPGPVLGDHVCIQPGDRRFGQPPADRVT